ncbi:MAG: VCBS repeat-containing protein [Pseudomonadota bacterium]
MSVESHGCVGWFDRPHARKANLMLRVLALLVGLASAASMAGACDIGDLGEAEFPDGKITVGDASAVYYWGTERYPHAVLGDALEPTALAFTSNQTRADGFDDCIGVRTALFDDMVFEDLTPRLVDITGDGHPEIITTRSHEDLGAQVAIYQYRNGGLEVIAETPHIGTRFRWLAIIGAADLDQDGHVEIAFIDRPHLAKTLRIWRYKNERLQLVTSMEGLSNHKIGEDFITSALRDCGSGDVAILVPNANRSELMEIRMVGDDLKSVSLGKFSAALFEKAQTC